LEFCSTLLTVSSAASWSKSLIRTQPEGERVSVPSTQDRWGGSGQEHTADGHEGVECIREGNSFRVYLTAYAE
jgi:hypothetical protein